MNYFDVYIKSFEEIMTGKEYLLSKKLFYSTQLNGPHIDFYHLPYSFNKKTPNDNFKKFQRKIIKSISNLLYCEKNKAFLSKHVVLSIVEQINLVLEINEDYWKNYGFDNDQVVNIKKTYNIYKYFLETYIQRLPVDTKNEKVYKKCIHKSLGINIFPRQLQRLGIQKSRELINKIEKISGLSFFEWIQKQKSVTPTPVMSESEVISESMKCISELYYHTKKFLSDIGSPDILIPEPHKFKVKPFPPLKAKWNSDEKIYGKYLFLNIENFQLTEKKHLMNMCAREVIPGNAMIRENFNKNLPDDKRLRGGSKFGIKAVSDGFSYYMSNLINNISDESIESYLCQLYDMMRIVIDTGLNSSNVDISLDIESARELMKRLTCLDDKIINIEILKCLASPGQSSSCGFGFHYVKLLEDKMLKKGFTKGDFCKIVYKFPLSFDVLSKYIDNIITE